MKRLAVAWAVIVLAGAVPALAEDDCFDKSGQEAIAACTSNLNSGTGTTKVRAIWFNNRAIEYRQLKQFDQAIADYSQAIRLDAKFIGAYTGRGLAYEGQKNPDRAKADYRKALTFSAGSEHADDQWGLDTARERLKALGN